MSQQLDSGSTRASRPRGLIAAVALVALVLGSAMFVASLVPQPAAAHEDPANCDQSGLGTVLGATPSGTVQVGDVITYTVTYTNSGATACNLTNLNANLVRPNGTTINVLVGATLNVGATINCPTDPGCAAGPYTYTVALADETGPVTGPACPPTPTGATLPRRVTAVAQSTATLHSVVGDDTAADCKSISRTVKNTPNVTTAIHNPAHQVVTSVPVGTTVHDSVSVVDPNAFGIPTGDVTIDWFLNGTCTGSPAVNSGPLTLDAAGNLDATGFAFTVNSPGFRGFKAHYLGDSNYAPADGPCEPLSVVDANIQITPNGVNRVGASHIFTGHVNVNAGAGFANAPDGTQISFTIDSGPGGFTTPTPCTTSGGTGSCQITLVSNVTGTTTVSAHTNVTVGGVSLTRSFYCNDAATTEIYTLSLHDALPI